MERHRPANENRQESADGRRAGAEPSFDRRQFLTGLAGSAIGATVARPALASGDTQAAASEGLWQRVRGEFEFSAHRPLNAANLCPAFSDVLAAQQSIGAGLSRDVGFLNRRDVVRDAVHGARQSCASLLGIKHSEDLALVRNTSEANAVVVNGVDLSPEDEVLLWNENHSTNYRSWHYRHVRQPFKVRTLDLQLDHVSDADIVSQFKTALNEHTRVVSFSQVSNISGARLPATAICRAIHAYNPEIFVHVDGAQSLGSLQLDLTQMDCDSFSSSAHKWLCGPRGVGLLYVRKRWARRLEPLILGYDFEFEYPTEALPDNARRFECLGQRDTAACAALRLAADKHLSIGPQQIEQRIADLGRYLRDALNRAGIAVRSPAGYARSHGVVIADLGGPHKNYGAFLALHNAGIASAFVHGNRVHCTPDAAPRTTPSDVLLRLCPHIYNTTEDIDTTVAIAERVKHSNFEIIKEVIRFL